MEIERLNMLVSKIMQVLSNLFGLNKKISANDIAVKSSNNKAKLLSECVIIDSGTNSSGEWIKFSNGKLITVHQVTRNLSRTSSWGNMYETSEPADLGNYPIEFKDAPYIYLTLYGQNALFEAVNSPNKTHAGTAYLLAPTANNGADYTIQVLAVGKWK